MTTPGDVLDVLCPKLEAAVPMLVTVWDHEPEQLGELPCATFLTSRIDPRETSTGPRLDVNWLWEHRVYVALGDWRAAQRQIEEIVFALLQPWRDDPTLGHLVEWWRIADSGQPPVFSTERRWLRKSLTVSAMIEQVPTA